MRIDASSLQHGFEQFIAAARELERSYAELKARAAQVDLELQATNQALARSLAEREAVFAALPLGLVTLRRGAVQCCNAEGERLGALLRAAGVDLAAARGDIALGDRRLRVQRAALPDGDLLVLEDRTHVHALEHEVHRLDRLAGLSELALGVAHEIKNPLNGIAGFAALLERATAPDAMRRFAAKVVQGVRQVDEIVKAMLGFAQTGRGRGRLCAVAQAAADAALAAGLPASRLVLSGRTETSADGDVLARVLAILFRNAVEAAPGVTVRLRAMAAGDDLELIVEDDGPGVAAELGQRAFEPFVSSKERGTGLGLPLALRVLAYLGGALELLNPGERGARFRIRMPLPPAAARTPGDVEAVA